MLAQVMCMVGQKYGTDDLRFVDYRGKIRMNSTVLKVPFL